MNNTDWRVVFWALAGFLLGLAIGFIIWGIPAPVEATILKQPPQVRYEEYKIIDISENCDATRTVVIATNTNRKWKVNDEEQWVDGYPNGTEATFENVTVPTTISWYSDNHGWTQIGRGTEGYEFQHHEAEGCEVPQQPVVNTITEAGPPQPPACEAAVWAPEVTYLGQDGHTFRYSWTQVKDGVHTYFVEYGPTADSLPYAILVEGEEVSITMEGNTNWMRVASSDNGCLGPFSATVN